MERETGRSRGFGFCGSGGGQSLSRW